MGREPREYSVWGTILAEGASRFVVQIRAVPVDSRGPADSLTQARTATTRAEAEALRLELLREICGQLAAQGNRIVDATLQQDGEDQ